MKQDIGQGCNISYAGEVLLCEKLEIIKGIKGKNTLTTHNNKTSLSHLTQIWPSEFAESADLKMCTSNSHTSFVFEIL